MKLSEILGWPLKAHEEDHPEHCLCGCRAWNICLSACDREIDREALANVLYKICIMTESHSNRKVDYFISTMPTWLKPTTERK